MITQSDGNKSHSHTFHGRSTNTGGMNSNRYLGFSIPPLNVPSRIPIISFPASRIANKNFAVDPYCYQFWGENGAWSDSRDYVDAATGGSVYNGQAQNVGHWYGDIDFEHAHSLTPDGYNDSTGDTETKPINYTIKIWERIA